MGKKKSPEAIEKSAAAHRGKKLTLETRAKMSIARMGKKLSLETRAKIRKNGCSLETRAKISAYRTGKLEPKIICPYCKKEGGMNAMKRWHFENCKIVKLKKIKEKKICQD